MTTKELINKYGYTIAYTDDKHQVVILVTKNCSCEDALKIANSHLKLNLKSLHFYDAWLKKNKVYFEPIRMAKQMWAITTCEL